jgi:16S rRNA (uracil1498-N3)-methyltransferase
MQFIYHENAGEPSLKVDGELFKYIFKVRRLKSDERLYFRNLKDKSIYSYSVVDIDRRKASLQLLKSEEKIIEPQRYLHIGWCVIDPKIVEKYIASLNELGVSKISFIYCEYSQKQYKPNFEKLEKILLNSSQQCGRSSIIQLEQIDSLEVFKEQNPNSYMFNFSSNNIHSFKNEIDTIIIGCEGGFSKDEVQGFDQKRIVGIENNLILRSETATLSVAGILLS